MLMFALGYRYRLKRPESDRRKCAAIFFQGDFTFGASIQVIENDLWQAAQRYGPQIVNVDDAGLSECIGCIRHLNSKRLEPSWLGPKFRDRWTYNQIMREKRWRHHSIVRGG